MDDRKVQQEAGRNSLHPHGVRVQAQVPAAHRVSRGQGDPGIEREVDVVTVDESWWHTRQRQGVHVLNPSDDKLTHAKYVAWMAGTNTVYCYRKISF